MKTVRRMGLRRDDLMLSLSYDRLLDDEVGDSEKRELLASGDHVTVATLTLNPSEPFRYAELVQRACRELHPLQDAALYGLVVTSTGTPLTADMGEERVFDLLRDARQPDDGCVAVALVVQPVVRAQRLLARFIEHQSNATALKKSAHEASLALSDSWVAEAFVAEQGLPTLKMLLERPQPANTVAYLLKALTHVLVTRAGLTAVVPMAAALMRVLYAKLAGKCTPSAAAHAASAITTCCGASASEGLVHLHAAAAAAGDADFAHLVRLAGDGNLATATQCLLLVGYLVASTPARDRAPLLARLNANGLQQCLEAQQSIRDATMERARAQFFSVCAPPAGRATVHRDDSKSSLLEPRAVDVAPAGTLVFGVRRGECEAAGCACIGFALVDGSIGGPCRHCGHFPARHREVLPAPVASPQPLAKRTSGREANQSGNFDQLASVRNLKSLRHVQSESLAPSSTVAPIPKKTSGPLLTRSAGMPSTPLLLEKRAAPSPLGGSVGGLAPPSPVFSPTRAAGSCPIIAPDDVVRLEEMGVGSSATVYRGLWRGQVEVAVKVMTNEVIKSQFLREMDTMMKLHDASDCVVQLFGVVMVGQASIVMEMCERGSLYHVLMQESLEWSSALALKLMHDAVAGLALLHSRDLVHRDVKSLNYLVTRDFRCKIADLGLARFVSPRDAMATLSNARGTLLYCAPEVFQGRAFERSFDVYSLGMVLWEVTHRTAVGSYQRPYAEYAAELRFDFQLVIAITQNNLRPTIAGKTPRALAALIQRCWSDDANERPSTAEALSTLVDCCTKQSLNPTKFEHDTVDAASVRTQARGPSPSVSPSVSPLHTPRSAVEELETEAPTSVGFKERARSSAARLPVKEGTPVGPPRLSIARVDSGGSLLSNDDDRNGDDDDDVDDDDGSVSLTPSLVLLTDSSNWRTRMQSRERRESLAEYHESRDTSPRDSGPMVWATRDDLE